jgi:hypothetical protein
MDGHAVCIVHLVKLVDADDAAVGKHHGTRLQPPLACTQGEPIPRAGPYTHQYRVHWVTQGDAMIHRVTHTQGIPYTVRGVKPWRGQCAWQQSMQSSIRPQAAQPAAGNTASHRRRCCTATVAATQAILGSSRAAPAPAPVSLSVVTAAVRPTPEEPRPVVETLRGAMFMMARSS